MKRSESLTPISGCIRGLNPVLIILLERSQAFGFRAASVAYWAAWCPASHDQKQATAGPRFRGSGRLWGTSYPAVTFMP